jgi:hypothetical protein
MPKGARAAPREAIFIAAHTGMCRVVGSFTLLENFDVYRNREVV